MLKTRVGDEIWLVTQPDHGQVAGYLAAHWGNDEFKRPGHYGRTADPERLRDETVFAIAQHDNGWWEWEAAPELSDADGLPLGLAEVLKSQQDGMNRWRNGLRRFPDHAHANLLISWQAYWLYAARVLADADPAFAHPLFWKGSPERLYPGGREEPLKFMAELEAQRVPWIERLRSDPATADWAEPENLLPHARLLQICDGLSLALCSNLIPARSGPTRGLGEDAFELANVPRGGWDDRATLTFTPRGGRRIEVSPYPFDLDPLPVVVPVRALGAGEERPRHFHTWRETRAPRAVGFEYVSGGR
jgi:hypothetical protein